MSSLPSELETTLPASKPSGLRGSHFHSEFSGMPPCSVADLSSAMPTVHAGLSRKHPTDSTYRTDVRVRPDGMAVQTIDATMTRSDSEFLWATRPSRRIP